MKNLFKALSAFQQEVPVLHKDTQGYGYTYTELSTIIKEINPLLKKHGLGFTQEIEGTTLKTTIFHSESGEFRESSADIPQGVTLAKMNEFQVLGSAITYIRRYALSAALGLVTDKDTDAAGEQVKSKPAKASHPANSGNANEPEIWLNVTEKGTDNLTPEWIKVLKGIEVGKVKSVQDVRRVYKVSKAVAEKIEEALKL